MSEATTFFKNLIEDALLQVNTGMPCKVISYDQSNRRAKVQPLFMIKGAGQEPKALPPLENVPVLFQRFQFTGDSGISKTSEFIPVLNNDDVVWVQFAQRALDEVLSGNIAFPNINRHHSLSDAVIVGVMS